MRCARCGNENLEGNRFCGMCGATLLTAPAPGAAGPAQGAATRSSMVPSSSPPPPAQPQSPPILRTSTPVSEQEPSRSISGPSFLGLNDPAPRKRASLSTDPYTTPHSRNLDYLLEEEEEPRHGGAGKFILILLALALAVGFGYLRWKNQGFGWLGSHTNKPSAAAQNSETPEASSTTPPASSTPSTPPVAGTGQTAAQPTPDIAGQPAPGTASPASSGAPAAVTPSANPPASGAPSEKAPAPADASGASSAANSSEPSTTTPSAEDAKEAPESEAENPPAASPKPSKPVHEPAAKPTAAKPMPAVDPVSEARKYLYGRGAAQDCDRGLRLLKPAANQSNAKAMIEMGALYSAGLCTPHDLPTAYRWFALALRKDPENSAVQADLQKLWGEMTQPERQLAIKLSQ